MKRRSAIGTAFGLLLVTLCFIPAALAWRTAQVDSYTTGTYYPSTVTSSTASPAPLLSCDQTTGTTVGSLISLSKNMTYSTSYFSCTNNWGTPVTFTITISDDNGTGNTLSGASLLIQPGQTKCITGTTFKTKNKDGDLLYAVNATASDLSATLQFAGTITIDRNPDSPACSFP
jgi:hypothetical protein